MFFLTDKLGSVARKLMRTIKAVGKRRRQEPGDRLYEASDSSASASQDRPTSHAPRIAENVASNSEYQGWHEVSVADWQNQAYRDLLDEMYRGDVRLDLQVAADAICDTGLSGPSVLEIGCGSGYYSEALTHLCGENVGYSGLDYSGAMISLAKAQYPAKHFVVGDATDLQFADNAFDIVLNGAALMHMPDYEKAIAEGRRVADKWCIYHTVPLVTRRPTTTLTKEAYGAQVIEITFNKNDFESLLSRNGLIIRKIYDNIPHDYLDQVMGEPVKSFTYLCEVLPA